MKTERFEIGGSLHFESVKYDVVEGYAAIPGNASFEFTEHSPDAWYSDRETSVDIDEEMARKLIDALTSHFGFAAQAAQPAQKRPINCGTGRCSCIECVMVPEDDDNMPGTWASACGELWAFTEGGPVENGCKFCHGCGGKLAAATSKENGNGQ